MKNRPRLKFIFILLIFTSIIGYAIFRTKDLFAGPSLIITSPANGTTVTDQSVEITGIAKRIAKIYLNNRQIFTDESGAFRDILLVGEGYTILTVQAEDRFGRDIRETIQLVYKPKPGASINATSTGTSTDIMSS